MPPPTPPPVPDPLIGATLEGRWRVIEPIGEGAMGVVYLAERVNLGRRVALKLLHEHYTNDPDLVGRFDREARAISRLQHIHCISILDFGVHEGRPYFVMELASGRPLTREVNAPTMTPVRAVALIRQVLLGLRHAHEHGIVHRDLKPDNVMVTELAGTGEVLKILDFGFAHMTGQTFQSNADTVPGTPSYMSPEQSRGEKTDLRTDLYSTGVMLYELCVGRRPFVSTNPMEILAMHVREPPPPPRTAAPAKGISEALERVILRALAKDRAERFPDAPAFQAALEATPEGRRALLALARVGSGASRWAVAVGAILAVLGAAGAAFAVLRSGPGAPAGAPSSPAPTPPPRAKPDGGAELAAPASTPLATVPTPEVLDRLVATGQFAEAERAFAVAIAANPRDANLHMQLGNLYFRQVWRKNALREWNEALAMRPVLRRDPELQARLCAALDARSGAEAQRLIVQHFGAASVGPMGDCMRRTRDHEALHGAAAVIEKSAGPDRVDRALLARRDLELAPTCDELRRAVQLLGRMRAKTALGALTALERERASARAPAARTACLGRAVRDAIGQLK